MVGVFQVPKKLVPTSNADACCYAKSSVTMETFPLSRFLCAFAHLSEQIKAKRTGREPENSQLNQPNPTYEMYQLFCAAEPRTLLES